MQELFSGWEEYPPTNLLLKALVEGFGGGKIGSKSEAKAPDPALEKEAFALMQRSVVAQIQAKAGPSMPVVRGRDKGLPKTAPVFDVEALKKRNAEIAAKFGKRR